MTRLVVRQIAMLLIGLFLFIGLPLFGWGITDVSGFLRHPARVGYLVLTVVLQIITIVMVPNLGRQASEGKKLVRRQKLALLFLQILSLALVIVGPYSDRHGTGALVDAAWLRYAGLVLYPFGFLIAHWAQLRLDKQFSVQVTIQEGHRLITGGPYKFLRHPRYLGIILFSTGASMIFRSAAGLALVALIAAVLVWRIHDEEVLLRSQFGGAWEEYRRRSWRLLPWVY
jgi:protein-S-isoprenylcysteine O-methyltransferase Ste14